MIYYPRSIEGAITGPESRGKVRMLFGARQTGKSTLLHTLADTDALFFNLQERSVRLEFERDPRSFTRILEARPDKHLTVCVDEIQKVPALLDEVQYMFDSKPGRYDFILTGSSARRLKSASANLLPGRAHVFHLCPLILPERKGSRLGGMVPVPQGKPAEGGFPQPVLKDLLLFGNLPGVIQEPAGTRIRTLAGYVELYLEEEIRREALVRNMGAFQQFLELAALESGQTMNLTGLSRESGVPVATLRTFYQVLEDTFVGYSIPAFGMGGRKRVLTTRRFLFFDLGVRNAAARLQGSDDMLKTQMGQLFENWVGLELLHRCFYAGRAYKLSFWRTVHGAEVDYVLETPREAIPIEVKATESPNESDARHVKLFLETYPQKAHRGFVVCRCKVPRKLTDSVMAIPWESV